MVQDSRTPANNDPIELSAQPADIVTINGDRYELARSSALSLRQRSRCAFLAKRLNALDSKDEPTDVDEAEYAQRLLEAAAIALPRASAEALAKLDHEQLGDLVNIFFVRSATRSRRIRELESAVGGTALMAALGAITGGSSHGSNGSTEGTPSDGST